MLDDDGGVEGGEIDLAHLFIEPGLGLQDHASPVGAPQVGYLPNALSIPLSKGNRQPPPQGLIDLIGGDEGAGGEAGGEVGGQAGEAGCEQYALQATLAVGEAGCCVYQYPALGDEGHVFVVGPAVAPVGSSGHAPKAAAPADGFLHPQPGRLSHQKRHPEVAPVHQKHIRIVKA